MAPVPGASYQSPVQQTSAAVAETVSAQDELAPMPRQPDLAAIPARYSLDDPLDPFAGQAELALQPLVGEVQARNPSLQAMAAAWRAAAERYPQVISLEDPMFGYMQGLRAGWMVEASQKIPWPCKRYLRGRIAQAEADAAGRDVEDTRLRLAEATRMAFFDYYLARRELEVNAATVGLMNEFREIAKAKYEANQVSEQDVLQANVELGDLETRRAEIVREERVAIARINTLLHRAADHPLPPPPVKLDLPQTLPAIETLQGLAVQQRPDLAAEADRVRAEEAAVALACKEFYPDFEIVAKHDRFMPEDMRSQIGMNLNVPLWRQRRCAAVREASARVQQRRAEYQDRVDQVQYEVQAAFERLAEGRLVVQLYSEKILPAARDNVQSARANYTTGKVDFLRLTEANRQLYRQQEKYYQAVADYHRRTAELERAAGGLIPLAAAGN